jgi:hypothetical protein
MPENDGPVHRKPRNMQTLDIIAAYRHGREHARAAQQQRHLVGGRLAPELGDHRVGVSDS